ncbi:MAG: hypothetical protein NZM04_01230, partial [Methylacidiphilales bacterium]|nr:hypothetical protein [Candidatus Methylacidiphilales bacterium]
WSDAARIERLHGQWQWRDLLFHSHIHFIDIEGIEIWSEKISRLSQTPDPTTPQNTTTPPASSSTPIWTPRVGTLTIKRATLFLENLLPETHTIPLTIAQDDPLILDDILLAPLHHQPISDKPYRAATGRITLYSPYDALLPVISIDSLELTFSWNALRRNSLHELIIHRPILYVGPGLFWLADAIQKKRAEASSLPGTAPPPVWTIENFSLRDGTLNIAAWGGKGFTIPMRFQSTFRNLRTDRLQELSLHNTLIFDPLTASYPDYRLSIENLRGEINFSLPLESNSNNLVPTLFLDRLTWNELTAQNLYLSVTFDPHGIYGHIGGHSYGGTIHAGFNIGYQAGFPWNAWITADQVNLLPITRRLTRDTFTLTGPLQGQLILKGRGKTIQQCHGFLNLTQPGKMHIAAVSELIHRLPADWDQPRRAIVQSALESFRHYPFTSGSLKWHYAIPLSHAHLLLQSPHGKRDFTLRWHQLPHPP